MPNIDQNESPSSLQPSPPADAWLSGSGGVPVRPAFRFPQRLSPGFDGVAARKEVWVAKRGLFICIGVGGIQWKEEDGDGCLYFAD